VGDGKTTENNFVNLKTIPMVRRLEYLDAFLNGVEQGLSREEILAALSERKKAFEIEKAIALGRGNPHRKDITRTKPLFKNCSELARKIGFIEGARSKTTLSGLGRSYLWANEADKKKIFCEAFSCAYPHLPTIISFLNNIEGNQVVLPLQNKPLFRPEAEKNGFSIGQMYFDTVRDLSTRLGLMNWRVIGSGTERRQHVYLACQLKKELMPSYIGKVHLSDGWLFAVPSEIERNDFREILWTTYLNLADRIPGSPVFYSSVRETVCANLKIRDDQFDNEVMKMVEYDEFIQVVWSEGQLQYEKDNASMLKSLPPKNEWGNYVVYLKMVRK
jgi:hypothetical protein